MLIKYHAPSLRIQWNRHETEPRHTATFDKNFLELDGKRVRRGHSWLTKTR